MDSRFDSEELNLQQYFQVLQRRWLLTGGVLGASVGLAGIAASVQQPTYTAEGSLLFQLNHASSLLEVNSSLEQLKSLNTKASPLSTQAVILQSAPILEATIGQLNLKTEEGEPLQAADILSRLTIEPVAGTDVIKLSFEAEEAEVAAAVVNEVMQTYIANDILNNRTETRAAREFITAQLKPTQVEVEQAAEALRQFLDTNKIVSLQDESSRLVSLVSELDSRINSTQADLLELNAQVKELAQQSGLQPDQAVALNSLNRAKGVQEVLSKYQSLEEQLTEAKTVYVNDSPQIQQLEREQAALRSLLGKRIQEVVGTDNVTTGLLQQGDLQQSLSTKLVETEVVRVGLQDKLRSLLNARETYRTQASRIPSLKKRQEELERRLKATQGIYESLLQKLQEIRVAENQNMGNARVIQAAKVPQIASRKMQLMLLAGGTFVGLSLGIAAAFLADLLDRSVRTVSDVKSLFDLTVVGLIPQYKTVGMDADDLGFDGISPRIVVANSPRSLVNESYQMLRANLRFMSSDHRLKSLVITSSVPGEGKSEVTANLAAAMAQVGRRVLVVDADMRNPSQHHLWGLVNAVGLSHVMVGQAKLEQAVQPISNRISVLTAGVVPPNPLALIDSKRMAKLIQHFAKHYDYVIFDTPPLAGMADAAVLGTMVDGVLLVTQPGVVNVDSANAAKLLLERSGPNVLGLVANGIDLKKNGDSYFYYGGEHGYGDPAAKAKSMPSLIAPR